MLEIKTTEIGAELTSVKLNGVEKLHQGQNYWKRHAPILFPIVGQLKNGRTIINKKEYELSQHGFARDMKFEKIDENKYLLKSSIETLEKYPYNFELLVQYTIKEDELTTKYEVTNKDNTQIQFGIGGHPAFICEYSTGDYQIEFEKDEKKAEFQKLESGLISNEKAQNILIKNAINLKNDIFENDAIIMKNLKSNRVSLYNKKEQKKILDFDFTGFPYLAIWSKIGAPFVCIEPWYNTADKMDSDGIFENKENILKLNPKQKFECEYKVKFY